MPKVERMEFKRDVEEEKVYDEYQNASNNYVEPEGRFEDNRVVELETRVEFLEQQVDSLHRELRLIRKKFRSNEPNQLANSSEEEMKKILHKLLEKMNWKICAENSTHEQGLNFVNSENIKMEGFSTFGRRIFPGTNKSRKRYKSEQEVGEGDKIVADSSEDDSTYTPNSHLQKGKLFNPKPTSKVPAATKKEMEFDQLDKEIRVIGRGDVHVILDDSLSNDSECEWQENSTQDKGENVLTSVDQSLLRRVRHRNFQCRFCPQRCRDNSGLKKHLRVHKELLQMEAETKKIRQEDDVIVVGEKQRRVQSDPSRSRPRKAKCRYCSDLFRDSYDVRRHELVHTDETRAFQCPLCNPRVAFAKQFLLNIHMKQRHAEETVISLD